MASKRTAPSGSGESATMASLRNYGSDDGSEVGVEYDSREPLMPPSSNVERVEGDVVREVAERTAQFVLDRHYGPNTTELVMWVAANALDTADLNRVIIEQMAIRFADATSIDDILDPFGTVKGQDMLDKPLWVTACTFLESDAPDGFPWYASLVHTDPDTGRSTVVTVGGEKLVMQAAAITQRDAWPQRVRIHKADRPTKAGFYPLELQPVR